MRINACKTIYRTLFFYIALTLFINVAPINARDESCNNNNYLTTEQLRQAEESIGNPESDQYNEDSFCEVLRRALISPFINEADKMRADYRLEVAAKNRPGTTAADFSYVTRKGKTENLHNLKTKRPILLLFYDPDCMHCMQAIEELKESSLPAFTDIVAIYAEEDRERWEETAPGLPEEWTVGFALDPIQEDETYVFITSPTIYLLDKKKTILLKNTSIAAASQYVATERNFKR